MMGVDGHACGGCESVDVTVSLCSFPQLFHSVMSARRPDQPSVTLHVFPADKGYGHNRISQAPDLGSLVRYHSHVIPTLARRLTWDLLSGTTLTS